MRKLLAVFATSIDGYIEGPNGEIDWITYDKEQFKELGKQWKETDAMFHGRKTYEVARATLKDSKGKHANPFAHMKHYVFSNTLREVEEGFILITGDIKKQVGKIKNQPGKQIVVFGGAALLCSLLNMDLVDELVIAICPVLLGKGKPFFPDIQKRIDWKVKEVTAYSSGLISITYAKK